MRSSRLADDIHRSAVFYRTSAGRYLIRRSLWQIAKKNGSSETKKSEKTTTSGATYQKLTGVTGALGAHGLAGAHR